MSNWSLVCFTLLIQSAVGLVWVGVTGRWFAEGARSAFSNRSMAIALALAGMGLLAALAHLARPRLAPKAWRNLASSWLSREVILVPAFAGAVALIILFPLRSAASGIVVVEATACLLGGAALLAMTRVYLLKTVPEWNTAATPLEFTGAALLLGGSLGAISAFFGVNDPATLSPGLMTAGISIILGVMLKLAAIAPALAGAKAARAQTWYEPAAMALSTGQVLALRMGLNLAGLVLIVVGGCGPTLLWSCLGLICIVSAEVMGRLRFYLVYRRIGL